VQRPFLEQFAEIQGDAWSEIEPGRIGRLRLRGPTGRLDIYVTYFQAGATTENRQARRNSIRKLAAAMAPKEHTLSLLLGDWNFCASYEDRWSKSDGAWTGGHDRHEAELFHSLIEQQNGTHEWRQPALTHECGLARSKLDRVYSNHAISDQLDRAYGCVALPQVPCSAHRPVAFSRKTPKHENEFRKAPTAKAIAHPDFARRVALEFHELQAKD
jgi:hypothetical protein